MAETMHLPLAFLSDAQFRTFQYVAQEPAAPLLGRLIVLASSVLCLSRVKFFVEEVDRMVAWQGEEHFASLLVRQGWAQWVSDDHLAIEVTLPDALQSTKRQTIAGRARAIGAVRDNKGRYLRTENTEAPAYPKRPALTVDSEGNVMFESLSGASA